MSCRLTCSYCGGSPAWPRRKGDPPTCTAHTDMPAREVSDAQLRELERQQLDADAAQLERAQRIHSRR